MFSTEGNKADPKKIDTIVNCEAPKNVNEIRFFPGIDDSTPVSQSRHTLRFQPIACRSIMSCPRVLTRPEMVWQAFVPDIASGQLAVFDMAEEKQQHQQENELLLWPA